MPNEAKVSDALYIFSLFLYRVSLLSVIFPFDAVHVRFSSLYCFPLAARGVCVTYALSVGHRHTALNFQRVYCRTLSEKLPVVRAYDVIVDFGRTDSFTGRTTVTIDSVRLTVVCNTPEGLIIQVYACLGSM